MTNGDTRQVLLREVIRILEPLANAAEKEQPAGLIDLVRHAGLDIDAMSAGAHPGTDPDLVESVQWMTSIAEDIQGAYSILRPLVVDGEFPAGEDLQSLASSIRSILTAVRDLDEVEQRLRGFEGFNVEDLARRLLEFLITEYLENYRPAWQGFLAAVGVISQPDPEAAEGSTLNVARFTEFMEDPAELIRSIYNWGGADFIIYPLLTHVQRLLWHAGAPALFLPLPPDMAALVGTDPGRDHPDHQLRIPILALPGERVSALAGISLVPLTGDVECGIAIVPFGAGDTSEIIPLHDGWIFRVNASAGIPSAYGILVRPSGIIPITPGDGAGLPVEINVEAAIERETAAGSPAQVVGSAEGSRLEVDTLGLRARFGFSESQAEFLIALVLQDARLVLALDEGDGFLRSLLPAADAPVGFSFTIGWSSIHGLHFEGSSGLSVTLPEHVEIGPVRISRITLQLAPGAAGGMRLLASSDISAELGPVAVTVEEIGFAAAVGFPADRSGNLGLIDFEFDLVPPKGAAILIDASSVVGGGYLRFDPDEGRYAGILQLAFHESLVLTAVGILTTRLPDGSEGFSLLVIICAEFPPIQLGFGFTLNGVGGLIGVHRTLTSAVLREGLKNQTLGSILFPKDPLRNAPQLISDLERVFPRAQDRFVIGPMAILGWGSPAILTAEIGVILTFPSPVELVVLGRMRMALPGGDAALVLIHMDVLGVVDLARGEAEIDATLYDSRIIQYSLTGDMAMRLRWSGRPNFALSVGGLNPRFLPPPNFPDLDRIAVSLTTGDNPRIRLEAYVALTSNTCQVGARVDLYAAHTTRFGNIYSISGVLLFDVLFEFSPFRFAADIGAGVTLKRNDRVLMAVSLDLMLAGPAPWQARGEATVRVCGFSGSISFDRSIGRREQPELTPPDPLRELIAALEDARNWNGELPPGEPALVTLRELPDSEQGIAVVHPMGGITVRQRVLPLSRSITRYGNTDLTENVGPITVPVPRVYSLSLVQLGGQGSDHAHTSSVQDYFAPAQFMQMSDDRKISSPSFEQMPAGMTIAGDGLAYPEETEQVELTYDEIIIDEANDLFSWEAGLGIRLSYSMFGAAARLGACARSRFRHSGRARFRGSDLGIRLMDHLYTVAGVDDLKHFSPPGISKEGLTYTEAHAAMNEYAAANAVEKGRMQVVGVQEVVDP